VKTNVTSSGAWPAGWYPDPWGHGFRRWDGQSWTPDVRPGAGSGLPPAPPVPVPQLSTSQAKQTVKPSARRGIKWSVVGAFSVATVVIASQMFIGNSVCRVEMPGGASFNFAACADSVDSAEAGAQLAEAQDELTERAENAINEAAVRPEADQSSDVDLTGLWVSTNSDELYEFQQYGSSIAVIGSVPGYVALTGQGVVWDERVTFDYYLFDGSYGRAELQLVDVNRLAGRLYNAVSGLEFDVTLQRQ
jgi:hypothetical protein